MITTAQYAVDGTAIKLVSKSETPKMVTIHSKTVGDLFINGTNAVTSSTGLLVDKATGPFTCEIGATDEMWAIAGVGTQTVTVMVITL